MDSYSEIDLRILKVAQEVFSQNGVLNTEMKDIASRLECSRSTLYRHFSSKSEILFVLAMQKLTNLENAVIASKDMTFENGFEAFNWQIKALVKALILDINAVTFLRDFDCLYTDRYPEIKQTEEYKDSISNSSATKLMKESYERGIKDGSIRGNGSADLVVTTIVQSCIAAAQRILPREQHYIAEHGYGRDLVNCQVDLLMSALKA